MKWRYLVLHPLLIFQVCLLAAALSIDALLAAFAYGSRNIQIPIRSVLLISLICSGILGLTLLLGAQIASLFNEGAAAWLSFGILFTLGVIRVFDSWLKNWIRRRGSSGSELKLQLFRLNFILQIYADPQTADLDGSRTLSAREAAALAVALSLDAIAAGLGIGLGGAIFLPATGLTFLTTAAAVLIGCKLGGKLAQKVDRDLSWLSGGLLIFLAVLQIL